MGTFATRQEPAKERTKCLCRTGRRQAGQWSGAFPVHRLRKPFELVLPAKFLEQLSDPIDGDS